MSVGFALPPSISKPRRTSSKRLFHDSAKLQDISNAKHPHDASAGAIKTQNMLSYLMCSPSVPNDTTMRIWRPPLPLQFHNCHTSDWDTICQRLGIAVVRITWTSGLIKGAKYPFGVSSQHKLSS